jgi:hypothetical protein
VQVVARRRANFNALVNDAIAVDESFAGKGVALEAPSGDDA